MTITPWGLTQRQVQAMAAYVASKGETAAAALVLGIKISTLHTTLSRARRKMDCKSMADAAMTWDRWLKERRAA